MIKTTPPVWNPFQLEVYHTLANASSSILPVRELTCYATAVVVCAKTTSDAHAIPSSEWPPNPNSQESTINTVAREIQESGGSALALPVNTRDHASIDKLVNDVVAGLGSIDVLIYNSGAIWWSAIETTPLKRYKLMQEVNAEGKFAIPAF